MSVVKEKNRYISEIGVVDVHVVHLLEQLGCSDKSLVSSLGQLASFLEPDCAYNVDELTADTLTREVEKACRECSHGLGTVMLGFSSRLSSNIRLKVYVSQIVTDVLKSYNSFLTAHYAGKGRNVSVVLSCNDPIGLNAVVGSEQFNTDVTTLRNSYHNFSPMERASLLCRLHDRLVTMKDLPNELRLDLVDIAQKGTLVESTLASETLTENGYPTVPSYIHMNHFEDKKIDAPKSEGNSIDLFENRIDVDTYCLYELVHPAYAQQTVVMASMLAKRIDTSMEKPAISVDVGSGPGTNLLMFIDLFKNIQVDAVEPSPAAYVHLQENTVDLPNVNSVRADFLQYAPKAGRPLDFIMSTGASHHFSTRDFLSKAKELLPQNGLLVIADEFLPEFSTRMERNVALIRHHLSYMMPLLGHMPKSICEEFEQKETVFIDLFEEVVPIAKAFADRGDGDVAELLCRRLLVEVDNFKLDQVVSHPLLAFYRLQILELQACVAGMDYEVEQKTHVRHFCQMAAAQGFKMVEHQRVYRTYGYDAMDGGTHVMCFRKT
jgi:SAM-dependent methyltransferase